MALKVANNSIETVKVKRGSSGAEENIKQIKVSKNGVTSSLWAEDYLLHIGYIATGVSLRTIYRNACSEPNATRRDHDDEHSLQDDDKIFYNDKLLVTVDDPSQYIPIIGWTTGSTSGTHGGILKEIEVKGETTITVNIQNYRLNLTKGTNCEKIKVTKSDGTVTEYTESVNIPINKNLTARVQCIYTAQAPYNYSSVYDNTFSFDSASPTQSATVDCVKTVKSYTLSISQGTGSTLTVKRTSSPYAEASTTGTLSNGATIYYGDVLSYTGLASTGYENPLVNGGSPTGTVTVTNNVSLTSSATRITWSFNVTMDSYVTSYTYSYGSQSGTKTGSYTFTGLDYADTITITGLPEGNVAYNYGDVVGNGSFSYSSNHYTVLRCTKILKTYAIIAQKNSNISSLSVKRTSSPYGGYSTGVLLTGSGSALCAYGDTLTCTSTAASEYRSSIPSINKTMTSNYTYSPTAIPWVTTWTGSQSAEFTCNALKDEASSTITINTGTIFTNDNIRITGSVYCYQTDTTQSFTAKVLSTSNNRLGLFGWQSQLIGEQTRYQYYGFAKIQNLSNNITFTISKGLLSEGNTIVKMNFTITKIEQIG